MLHDSSIVSMKQTNSIRNSERWEYLAKLAIIGDPAVGKTSMLHRYSNKNFTHRQAQTLGN